MKKIAGLNPRMLEWARRTSGLSIEDVADAMKKKPDAVRSWESGESSPTYVQLEDLAYKVYKRPLALLFFPEPPEEPPLAKSFRTLPQTVLQALSADTLYALRQARAMQLALYELTDAENASSRKVFRDIRIRLAMDKVATASRVRKFLGVPLASQIRWSDPVKALKEWREAIQESGLFVFKRSLKQRSVSGFCLSDKEFPVIFLNNSTSPNRQIFTLFHELAHVLVKTNGITSQDNSYIASLRGHARDIEVFCNAFAAEFLVPWDDFRQFLAVDFADDRAVGKMSQRYKVSREVILRRALDAGLVELAYYRRKARQWAREYQLSRSNRSGGNYYATQATYLGRKFLGLAFRRYYQRRCTIEQLADYLNVKVKNVAGLEPLAFGRTAE